MSRQPSNDATRGLMPWAEVARRVGLPRHEVVRIAELALLKLRAALAVLGVERTDLFTDSPANDPADSREYRSALLDSQHGTRR